jgi:hypothetical protein
VHVAFFIQQRNISHRGNGVGPKIINNLVGAQDIVALNGFNIADRRHGLGLLIMGKLFGLKIDGLLTHLLKGRCENGGRQ